MSNNQTVRIYRLNDILELEYCDGCKNTPGYTHKSIYMVGPGYYDPPDPNVYCSCQLGRYLETGNEGEQQ